MRVLVIGSGGREHALVWKLASSPRVEKVYCVPGNPGISKIAHCVQLDTNDNFAMIRFAVENKVDLTVVGPEAPLANGIVDAFAKEGLKIFGPSKAAAQIEGSKAFAKDLMKKYNIPTAGFEVFTEAAAAKEYIKQHGAPVVVKADGLAAGKGVIVAMTLDEALNAIDAIMCDKAFGSAGSQVVVEDYLTGEEASLLAFTDGKTIVPMVAAQDHKRIYDGDKGPNTGGMGAYAPAPVVNDEIRQKVMTDVLKPIIAAMANEGCPYKGCLYAGLMITEDGPKVIEFNARFGDPETQVVLPLLESDLTVIMEACIDGTLCKTEVEWQSGAAVCVVLAAQGYPSAYRKGDVINGIEQAEQQGALVFHAGTKLSDGHIVTNGGRVLGVTAVASDLVNAIKKTYEAVNDIDFKDVQYRRDIAHRALR